MSAEAALDGGDARVFALWELLEAEREAARRADGLALLTLQEMKRQALADLPPLDEATHEALTRYARENIRRIHTLLRCYEGCLDVARPDTYQPRGQLRAIVPARTTQPATVRNLRAYAPETRAANNAKSAAPNARKKGTKA